MEKTTEFKKIEFITSIAKPEGIKDFGLDEIAVVGRSNVGKSSFINMLAGKAIARTSKEPGRTRLLNLFNFDSRFILVDLPGYGFARAGKSEQGNWQKLIESYLLKSTRLKNVLLLVDIRHQPTDKDLQMLTFLFFHNIPFAIIATKADKIAKSKLAAYTKTIAATMKVGIENVFVVSNTTKQGKDEIKARMLKFLENKK